MTNAELIKALQCASHFALYQDCYEKNCYANSGKGLYCNIPKLIADAADALEELQQIADHYDQNAKDYWKEACEYKQRIAELEKQDSVEMHKKQVARIAELEAQLPKEGEWIEVHDWLQIPQEERGTYRCSACGQVMKYPWNYCPNCGSVMKGGCK